ncbi:MAG: lysylphosphatidylglycerol synthase transmembrane domain-containing protein [Candidatus Latescibacterota bacterium]|nr:lysylphosphatidylglycerol synthase transmembrane domain-containing protein [Candidatus Latescibacterota bacterium]
MVVATPLRLIGIIFFLYLVWQADFHSIYSKWERITWIYIFPLPLLSGLMLTLRALRWRLLLNVQGVYLSPQTTWIAYAIGVFCGIVTPGRLGDLAKAFYVRERTGFDWPRSLSSAVVDRALDIGFMGLATLWAIFYLEFPNTVISLISSTSFLFVIGLIFALFIIIIVFMKVFSDSGNNWFLVLNHLKIGLAEAKGMLSVAGPNCVILTFLAYGLYFLLTILLAKSISMPLLAGQVVAAIILVGIASYLPISIAGLGTREAMLLLVMNQLQIENSLEVTLIFSSLFFVFCFVVPGSIGFICFWRQPMSFTDFRNEIQGEIHGRS